jgi:23S rRNA pseudouridine1911/1915/1917 synthase
MADPNQVIPQTPYRILFEDQHLIVISKPAGLLSQGDISGEPSLVDHLRTYFGRNYVGLLHRLDRNTTGLMVIAKRSKSAERLTKQLQDGELARSYHAILFGKLDSTEALRWEHWLLKNESTNEVRVVRPGTPSAKSAALTVTPLYQFLHEQSGTMLTVAKFELETGRSHQIRVQALAAGHPLVGDTKYGNAKSLTLFHRPALHSCELTFFHPISREKMTFQERYSPDMIAYFPVLSDH